MHFKKCLKGKGNAQHFTHPTVSNLLFFIELSSTRTLGLLLVYVTAILTI